MAEKNILELQERHKEMRRLRREQQQQMLIEQKRADNMEVITSMYKRKQLTKKF